jgi:hypothetical protein
LLRRLLPMPISRIRCIELSVLEYYGGSLHELHLHDATQKVLRARTQIINTIQMERAERTNNGHRHR